jgi:hypothetical protein
MQLKEEFKKALFLKYLESCNAMRNSIVDKVRKRANPDNFDKKYKDKIITLQGKMVAYLNSVDFSAILEKSLKVIDDEDALKLTLNLQFQSIKEDLNHMIAKGMEGVEE